MKRLRFALAFNGATLERWHLQCLDHLEEVAELVTVIVAPPRQAPAASKPMRWYARRIASRSTVDVTERFGHMTTILATGFGANPPPDSAGAESGGVRPHRFWPRPKPLGSGPTAFGRGRNGSSETAHLLDVDFVLQLGRVSVPAELRAAAREGIWCFEHESGGELLPFFREVHDAEDVTRAALLDDGGVLQEGYFRTDKRSYVVSREGVLDAIAAWPARVCRRLLDGASRGTGAVVQPRGVTRRLSFLRFVAGIARRRLGLAWERLFRHPQWNVGVLAAPVGTLLAPGAYADAEIDWFPLDDRAGFLADPFGIVCDGKLHVLCEYFDYRASKGHIWALTHSGDGFTTQPAPELPHAAHASYPFLLERSDDVYCIPELSETNEIALFRATEFPQRWSKVAVLVEDFPGVDPTVFRHDGRWWLTCTRRGAQEDAELWVWHAPDLLGPWTEHARNPVKTDVRSARPGGAPFVHEGVLYRPAQDCSKTYGWRIAVQRVTRLTPTEFAEEPATVLQASPESPFPSGPHTLTPVGDVVLVDGRRTVFVWPALRAFLRIWLLRR